MKKIYVNKEIEIFDGADAEVMFSNKNDVANFKETIGINCVDKNRWKEAQYYEKKTWCESNGKYCMDDRNNVHFINFDSYKILPSIVKNDCNVIELGCGPYTNLRSILPILRKNIINLDLLDPLTNDYILTSPNCSYKSGTLNFTKVKTYPYAIEEFKPERTYDLVVMINVLEHCYDVDKIFEKIQDMLNPGGIFVFGDRFYADNVIKDLVENVYDAGHPIRLSTGYIQKKLENFDVLYSNDVEDEYNSIDKYCILQLKK